MRAVFRELNPSAIHEVTFSPITTTSPRHLIRYFTTSFVSTITISTYSFCLFPSPFLQNTPSRPARRHRSRERFQALGKTRSTYRSPAGGDGAASSECAHLETREIRVARPKGGPSGPGGRRYSDQKSEWLGRGVVMALNRPREVTGAMPKSRHWTMP